MLTLVSIVAHVSVISSAMSAMSLKNSYFDDDDFRCALSK